MSGPEVDSSLSAPGRPAGLRRLLPPIGSPRYHLLLGGVAIFILGPLGGISAAFMNFSIGFFIGGQVLAGILGSTITLGYGPEGKHGANYMQTMAASVAGILKFGVPKGSTVVCVLTGNGLKDPDTAVSTSDTPLVVDATLKALLAELS